MKEKQKENKETLDVFEESLKESSDNLIKVLMPQSLKAEPINDSFEESQMHLACVQTEEGDKWDNLASYVNGDGAERLMKELKAMPGKDYVRNYLKLLEHFKPKLVRSETTPLEEVDRTINVQIVQALENGQTRIITLNNINEEEE